MHECFFKVATLCRPFERPIDAADIVWVLYAKQAGIKRWNVRPHTLRHTLNVIRRQAKLDPMVRSALLTHTSPQSIVSYEHLMPEELVDARAQQRRGLAAYLQSATGNYENEKCALPPTQEPDA